MTSAPWSSRLVRRGLLITPKFREALRRHDLRAFLGDDATAQPGNLAQVLLHETAVAWTRHRLTLSLPAAPWEEETREAFGARLREAARYSNANYDVEGLCRSFPKRIQDLVDREGDNLRA